MPRKPQATITQADFQELYATQGHTLASIASQTGVPTTTLNRWMKLWGIPAVRRSESYLGRQFGQWAVLEEVVGGCRGAPSLCRCRCACGTEKWIPRGNLQQGLTQSCGCLHRIEPGQAGLNKLIDGYRRSALQRGLVFDLSTREMASLTVQHCFYCGSPPQQLRQDRSIRSRYRYNGLDRQDPSQGYLPGNVVAACWQCNHNKATQTVGDFLSWVRSIHTPTFEWTQPETPILHPQLRAARNNYRSKAKWRGLGFNLSDSQVSLLFGSPCAYCGSPPMNGRGYTYSGIDRKDNSQGYLDTNCVPACQRCNYAKLDQSVDDFLGWVARVQAHTASISSK